MWRFAGAFAACRALRQQLGGVAFLCARPSSGRALSAGAAAPDTDAVVVGAGVVGLACARALAQAGHDVLILEQAGAIGTGTSSRNSEVIHAGIYYPPGSLKARLCVEGRHMLYDYCAARGVEHKRLGKLIVATDTGQHAELGRLQAAAAANGVSNLRRLSGEEAASLEPQLRCSGALLSPSTGIVDSHGLMQALLADAEAAGASLALRSRLASAAASPDRRRFDLQVEDAQTGEVSSSTTRMLVNAAGLFAQDVAARISGLPPASIPRRHLAKGNYFALGAKAPFSRLVYPIPEPGGLGVHITLDLAGAAKFGPDVEWLAPDAHPSAIDYGVDPHRAARFYPAIRAYWPGLPNGALAPSYAGVRPKVAGPGEPPGDFLVQGKEVHGVTGLVNLYGIESPGLTASLALAAHVARALLA